MAKGGPGSECLVGPREECEGALPSAADCTASRAHLLLQTAQFPHDLLEFQQAR